MKNVAGVLCVVFSFCIAASAQSARRTVTNADLAKFESRRVEAEREYRQTYASKGMLSPEAVNAIADARVQQTIELADQLRSDQLERDRLALEANAQRIQREQIQQQTNGYPVYYENSDGIWGYGIYGGGFYGNVRFRGRRLPGVFGRGVYAAGGNVWPAPAGSIQQRPQPAFSITGRSRGRH